MGGKFGIGLTRLFSNGCVAVVVAEVVAEVVAAGVAAEGDCS